MCQKLLGDATLYALLSRIEEDLAAETRAQRCPLCGGPPHCADYPRKPRGGPPSLGPGYGLRLSFCCADCRKRRTPPSARFLGRRVYLGVVVVLVTALQSGLTPKRFGPLREHLGVALRATPRFDDFAWRIENALAPEGGFALITGEPGTGESVTLRLLADRLSRLREVRVGSLEHPQSQMADFYREMGDLFGVELRPHNRWAGFKALRESWLAHVDNTLMRPVLLVDEAQEMSGQVLSELRILTSTRFDSRSLLGVVLAGDGRLDARLWKVCAVGSW